MALPGGGPRRWLTAAASVAVTALAAALVALLPHAIGASWGAIGHSMAAVPVPVLAGLAAVWFLGLLVHVVVQRTALPGLSTRQALTLNLAGSAVSNVLPLGGPAGMGLGYAMARSWGFGADRFASYVVATNLWNALGKFTFALGVLAGALLLGAGLPTGTGAVILSASVFIVLAAGTAAATFRTERSAHAVGATADAVLVRLHPAGRPTRWSSWLVRSRAQLTAVLRGGWRRMTLAVLTYLVLQAALLYACLAAVGTAAPVAAVAVAFAVDRLISLAPITPGAAGLAELGTVAALHALGVDPVAATAGVLIYRILVFAVEIPIGGLLLLRWARRARPSTPPEVSTAEAEDVAGAAA
jgi:uncharacterized protein (TIRG00374 family)